MIWLPNGGTLPQPENLAYTLLYNALLHQETSNCRPGHDRRTSKFFYFLKLFFFFFPQLLKPSHSPTYTFSFVLLHFPFYHRGGLFGKQENQNDDFNTRNSQLLLNGWKWHIRAGMPGSTECPPLHKDGVQRTVKFFPGNPRPRNTLKEKPTTD